MWHREAEEKFTLGFEGYLQDGKDPNEYLTGLTCSRNGIGWQRASLVNVPAPVVAAPKVWTVEFNGKQYVSVCKDTPAIRPVVENIFNGSLNVDNATKTLTIHKKPEKL